MCIRDRNKALELSELFGRDGFYLEIQDHGLEAEKRAAEGLLRIHRETGIPLAVTNDAHYVEKDDAYYQDVLMCVQMQKTITDIHSYSEQSTSFVLTPRPLEALACGSASITRTFFSSVAREWQCNRCTRGQSIPVLSY